MVRNSVNMPCQFIGLCICMFLDFFDLVYNYESTSVDILKNFQIMFLLIH